MQSPSNVTSLRERLRAKIETDRSEIEALTSNELRRLAGSLSRQSSDALHSTASAIGSEMQSVQQRLTSQIDTLGKSLGALEKDFRKLRTMTIKSWAKPVLVAASVFMGIYLGSLGVTRYLSWSIESLMREREELKAELVDIRRVRSLAETWGVEFSEEPKGRFLILPPGTKPEADWTCGKKPCVRLGRR